MTFTKEELGKFNTVRLIKLAEYLDVPVPPSIRRDDLIDKLLMVLHPPEPIPPKVEYLEGETPENPLYSVRVRRIMQSKQKGEL